MLRDEAGPPATPTAKQPATTSEAGTTAPNWELTEFDYRAGIKSLRQIAGEQGVSEGAIRKRAKRDGWERDLSSKIQAKADDLVRKQVVRSEVRTERAATERQVVEANAEAVAAVRMSHRRDIQRSRSIVMRLLDELELQTGSENSAMLQALGDMLRKEDQYGRDKLNDLYHKIISLPGRAKTMKDLGESLRVLITLERLAFGMDAPGSADSGGGIGVRQMTDAERAVRLSRLLSGNPEALAAFAVQAGKGGEQ